MVVIKFVASTNKGPMLGLGLSMENMRRLAEDDPIVFDLGELGWSLVPVEVGQKGAGQVLIMAGENEVEIGRKLGIETPTLGPGESIHIRGPWR